MEQVGKFLEIIAKQRFEEDFVDRLNYSITGYILLFASITVGAGQWFGQPLKCWTPMQFPGGWDQYLHDYCYVENTYWLPFEQRVPTDHDERDAKMLNYYQWVQIVLALQALMFHIPHLLWRSLNWMSGVSVRSVIGMATLAKGFPGKEIDMIANHIRDGMEMTETSRVGNPIAWIFRFGMIAQGTYITFVYLIVKLLFFINIILQFAILHAFLGPNYRLWGADILFDLLRGDTWFKSGHFPRVTLCDFKVRVLGNLQNFTVQCVLNINMLNEKIYIFLWWWFIVLLIATVLSIFYWAFHSLMPSMRRTFVVQMLNAQGLPLPEERDDRIDDFVDNHLRTDGVFVLRLLSKNAGALMASFVVARMWKNYQTAIDKRPKWPPMSIEEEVTALPEKQPLH